jgi:hypothetical protein
MTLSILLYALMVCSLVAVICVLAADGVRDRIMRFRPIDLVAPCVPGRVHHGRAGSPSISRTRHTPGLRRR